MAAAHSQGRRQQPHLAAGHGLTDGCLGPRFGDMLIACNMLSIWIVESKSKGPGLTRAVSTPTGGTAPRTCRRERPSANPILALRSGPPPPPDGAIAGGSRVAAAGGRRGLRGRKPGRRARGAPALPPQPERKGAGRRVEAGERLETCGRREPDALRASESEGRPWPCLVCAGQATVANFDQ